MRFSLPYGKEKLSLTLPDDLNVTVIEPVYCPGMSELDFAFDRALKSPQGAPPLREWVKKGERIGIVFSDLTRPAPNRLILSSILRQLDNIPFDDITLFNALGAHRPNTETELVAMLGEDIVRKFRIVQNNAFDHSTQAIIGLTSFGNEVWIDSELARCDRKILTGFIEPHLFAGFSGGAKAILPGMSGLETILRNHSARMIGDPYAIYGELDRNPVAQEIREAGRLGGQTFLVNVALNRERQVTGIFAGAVGEAHRIGCEFVSKSSLVQVKELFDIVITTNSGFPLDINLYQSVKGMRAADLVTRPGGAIIIATRCEEGIPAYGKYGELLRGAANPEELLKKINSPGFLELDSWQAQIQALIQQKAKVYVKSDGLSVEQVREAHLFPCENIEDTVEELVSSYGRRASICVLPEGPQTIPYYAP